MPCAGISTLHFITRVLICFTVISFSTLSSPEQKPASIKKVNTNEIKSGTTTIAITGAIIIDGNGGAPSKEGTVIVTNGKITNVGKQKASRRLHVSLTKKEWQDIVITNCDDIDFEMSEDRYPYAFTQHGVTMLASVLKCPKARKMNIAIYRAFIALRKLVLEDNAVWEQIDSAGFYVQTNKRRVGFSKVNL